MKKRDHFSRPDFFWASHVRVRVSSPWNKIGQDSKNDLNVNAFTYQKEISAAEGQVLSVYEGEIGKQTIQIHARQHRLISWKFSNNTPTLKYFLIEKNYQGANTKENKLIESG